VVGPDFGIGIGSGLISSRTTATLGAVILIVIPRMVRRA
jgi:uncharacterized membrane protein YeaQ/YmgE (transglycosylase-associated protein family)